MIAAGLVGARARVPSGRHLAVPLAMLLAGCGAKVVVDTTGSTGSAGTGGAGAGTGGTTGTAACVDQSLPEIPGLASAIATPQTGDGSLLVDLSSSSGASCADPLNFPAACASAWRVRLQIPVEQQKPGTYALDLNSAIFAYLDAQAPGTGTQCQNLGKDYAATLVITAIDATHLAGKLCGNASVQGTFVATMCASCQGVNEPCTSDADCCQMLCTGTCQP